MAVFASLLMLACLAHLLTATAIALANNILRRSPVGVSTECDIELGHKFLLDTRMHNKSICDMHTHSLPILSYALLYSKSHEPGCKNNHGANMTVIENSHLIWNGTDNIFKLEIACWDEGVSQLSDYERGGIRVEAHADGVSADFSCQQWVDEDTIIIGNPRGEFFGNFYHTMEEIFAIFETAEVLGRNISDFRYIILWQHEGVPELMQLPGQLEGFSSKRIQNEPARAIPQMIELWSRMMRRPEGQKFKPLQLPTSSNGLCFRRAVLPMRTCLGSILPASWDKSTPCLNGNPIAFAVAQTIRNAFKVNDISSMQAVDLRVQSVPVVTFLIRKNITSRMMSNNLIDNIAAALRALPAKPTVRLADPTTMTMEQQVALIQNTSVLIGVHGAGLMHLMELPIGAGIVEITPAPTYPKTLFGFRPKRSVANIFTNLALWTGHPYRSVTASGDLDSARVSCDIDDVVSAVQSLLGSNRAAA